MLVELTTILGLFFYRKHVIYREHKSGLYILNNVHVMNSMFLLFDVNFSR